MCASHRTNSQEWLDTREAFIDLVAVNVFGGKGTTDILLGNPLVDGVTIQRSQTEVELSSLQRLPAARNHAVRLEGSIMTIDDRPFAPRIVKPHGEPWSFLAELGFNTLWLDSTPSAEQVALAEKLDLWLVARVPAIDHFGILNSHLYRRVLAWNLDAKTTGITSAELSRAIRQDCGTNGKPLLTTRSHTWRQNENWANVIVHGNSPLGTHAAHRSLWCDAAKEHSIVFAHHTPLGNTAKRILPSSVQRQISLMERSSATTSIAVEPTQLSVAASEALAQGARAICIADDQRLDGVDLASQIRAATVKKWNQQHRLLAPWLLSGRAASIEPTAAAELQLAIFATNRSKLAIPLRRAEHQQLYDHAGR